MPVTAKPTGRAEPIRAGDVFDYAGTGRAATVFEVLPGGRAQLRIEGYKADGKKLLRIGEDKVSAMRGWKRLGRAVYQDGNYNSVLHLAKAPAPSGG